MRGGVVFLENVMHMFAAGGLRKVQLKGTAFEGHKVACKVGRHGSARKSRQRR